MPRKALQHPQRTQRPASKEDPSHGSGVQSRQQRRKLFSACSNAASTEHDQHCKEKHLQRYLNEFDFRYNSRDLTDQERAAEAIKGAEGKRITYRRIDRVAA